MGNGKLWHLDENIKHRLQIIKLKNTYDKYEMVMEGQSCHTKNCIYSVSNNEEIEYINKNHVICSLWKIHLVILVINLDDSNNKKRLQ